MNRRALLGSAMMVLSETATLAGIEPFWSLEHANRLDRLHHLRRRDRLARARQIVDSIGSARVRLPRARIDPALARVRVLQPVHRQLVLRRPARRITLLRYFGYAWSFATIWPAIFEGAELVAVWRRPCRPLAPGHGSCLSCPPYLPFPPVDRPSCLTALSMIAGAAMLAWPLILWPSPLSRGARLARLHLPARTDQHAPRRRIAHSRFRQRRQFDRLKNLIAERIAVRRPMGVLELLGARQVALHGAHHGEAEDLRDAGAGLLRVSGVRARMLHDVRLCSRLMCSPRDVWTLRPRGDATALRPTRSHCNFSGAAL